MESHYIYIVYIKSHNTVKYCNFQVSCAQDYVF